MRVYYAFNKTGDVNFSIACLVFIHLQIKSVKNAHSSETSSMLSFANGFCFSIVLMEIFVDGMMNCYLPCILSLVGGFVFANYREIDLGGDQSARGRRMTSSI